MANATFYTTAKKQNSTLQPSGGTTIDVKLKDGTDLISPVFILNYGSVPNWSCAQFEGRYYFVTNIESVRNDLWAISCSVDALATYKQQIGAQTLYIVRSSNRFDGAIVDTNYPVKTGVIVEETETNSPYDAYNFSGGTYVVGIIGADNDGVGAVTYYAFQQNNFNSFMDKLMGDITDYNVGILEVSDDLQKMLFNPFQYIASCVWFPFDISKFSGSDDYIKYGWWNFSDTRYAKKLDSVFPITIGRTLQTLAHPQQQSRGAYLSAPPYTRKFLRYMPFGIVEIEPQIYYGADNIGLWLSVDIVTGAGILQIYKMAGDDWIDSQIIQAQIGVQVQIAQMNLDYAKQMNANSANVAFWQNALTQAGNFFGIAQSTISAVGSAEQARVPTLQSNSMNGGTAALQGTVSCIHHFQTIADEDNAHRGRPYCQLANIADTGGFMIVSDADFDIACTDTERNIIRQHMESGFYYE